MFTTFETRFALYGYSPQLSWSSEKSIGVQVEDVIDRAFDAYKYLAIAPEDVIHGRRQLRCAWEALYQTWTREMTTESIPSAEKIQEVRVYLLLCLCPLISYRCSLNIETFIAGQP